VVELLDIKILEIEADRKGGAWGNGLPPGTKWLACRLADGK
jgi:hypothetical protein